MSKSMTRAFRAVGRHTSEILTFVGIVGAGYTVFTAVRATPKAMELIEARKKELGVDELTKKEVVKTAYKCYIPCAITGVVSFACIATAQSKSTRRNAALAAAYKLSEDAYKDYRKAVSETVDSKTEKDIVQKMAENRMAKEPPTVTNIYVNGSGKTLCYDNVFGGYFMSSIDDMKRGINEFNEMLFRDDSATLNELRELIGAECIPIGESMGYDITWGIVKADFTAHLTEKGEPAIAITYNYPELEYWKLG